ncbi:MAG: cyanobactin biosynthesis PatC/TenC/TruC family protein [Cyanobacteria bacterium P01_A01_bin.68]
MTKDKASQAEQGNAKDKQEDTTKQIIWKNTSAATGLEDYAYWLKTIAKEQAAKAGEEKKPFRRGRIWA